MRLGPVKMTQILTILTETQLFFLNTPLIACKPFIFKFRKSRFFFFFFCHHSPCFHVRDFGGPYSTIPEVPLYTHFVTEF